MRSDDTKFLKRFSAEFEKLFPEGTNFSDIITAICDKKLPIEKDGQDISKKIDISVVKEIENTFAYLVKITEKPHSFIKIYEDKINVSTVKRINSKAISHLSRNSNDWFARTFLTVIPKNILADVNEETFDLYENRFIVTLIDRILEIVINKRIEYDKIFEELNNDRIQNRLMERGYIPMTPNSNEISRKLLGKKNHSHNIGSFEEILNDKNKLSSFEKKIKKLKQSHLYYELRKCHRVQNPIQKTNIIVFDPRYNAAYRLWEYLNKNISEEVIKIDESEQDCLPVWYKLFALVTIFGALKDMGFFSIEKDEKDCIIIYKNNNLSLKNQLRWKKNEDVIRLFYSNGEIKLDYCIDEQKDKWDKIIINPDITINFEDRYTAEVREQLDKIIDKLASHPKKKDKNDSCFYFISIDILKCSDANDWEEKIYRRLFNIGDNYPSDEEKINGLSNYQSGILMITPDNFQMNFLRIQRLVNSRIFKTKIDEVHTDICPICRDKNIKRLNKNEIICNNCKHYISKSSCSKCNSDFLWIKYSDDKFFNDDEITKNFETNKYFIKIMRSETMMREYAITSFSIEKDKSGAWKLKSLCPKCGRILGN